MAVHTASIHQLHKLHLVCQTQCHNNDVELFACSMRCMGHPFPCSFDTVGKIPLKINMATGQCMSPPEIIQILNIQGSI